MTLQRGDGRSRSSASPPCSAPTSAGPSTVPVSTRDSAAVSVRGDAAPGTFGVMLSNRPFSSAAGDRGRLPRLPVGLRNATARTAIGFGANLSGIAGAGGDPLAVAFLGEAGVSSRAILLR